MEYLVQINYKSGESVKCWFKGFTYKKINGKISIEWEVSSTTHRPLFIGVDDIESIWQLEAKEL